VIVRNIVGQNYRSSNARRTRSTTAERMFGRVALADYHGLRD
jgi:hypothetical protein